MTTKHGGKIMHKKRRFAGLLTAILLAAVVSGCSAPSTTADASDNKTIASFTQGTVNEDELYDRLISETGMTIMLEMVDKGILDVVEPVDEDMNATADESIVGIKEYYGDDFENALAANGFKGEEAYRDTLLLNLQRNAYITKYVEKEVLTTEEIQAYYDAFEPQIEASHILISPEGDTDADWTKAETTAKDLIVRIEAGEAFADLAMEYSNDAGSGAQGGVLGPFGKGAMVPEFEAAAFGLEVGAVTAEPVKTQFGYHIILKTAGEGKATFEEMRPEIVSTLAEGILQADEKIGYVALVQMREENGFVIENEVMAPQYETFTTSLEVAE